MEEYVWKPRGLRISDTAIVIEPIVAFKHFVLPGLSNPNWIEDGEIITDTGMRKREWAGLILHSICLSDLTDRRISIAKDNVGGDGAIITNEGKNSYGCYVEQTLVTHRSEKHSGLLNGIEERLMDKSSKGENYVDNKHLIIMLNEEGEIDTDELAKIISKGSYNIVNVIGYNNTTQHYLCYLYDKDKDQPIHKCAVDERALIIEANSLQ